MIVIGLGNPGNEHATTRHNLGWMVLDALASQRQLSWKLDRSANVWVASLGQHLLLKPNKFMNLSGQSFMQFWKYRNPDARPQPHEILVVHDEIDLPVGTIREQMNRSAAGHQGVASLIEALGSQDFHRLRIGIGDNRPTNLPAEEYVLQKFSAEDQAVIDGAVDQAVTRLLARLEK